MRAAKERDLTSDRGQIDCAIAPTCTLARRAGTWTLICAPRRQPPRVIGKLRVSPAALCFGRLRGFAHQIHGLHLDSINVALPGSPAAAR